MGSTKSPKRQYPFLLGSTCGNLLRCAIRYGGISPRHWLRFASLFGFTLIGVPMRIWESLRHHPAARRTKIEPIFIVGQWQSGLSPLQFLLANDPQFAYLNLYNAEFPWSNISTKGVVGPIVARATRGKSRGSDSFKLHLGLPQGSDWPMASGTDLSFYHAYVFPQRAEEIFRRSILFEGVSSAGVARWRRLYRFLIQKIAYKHQRTRVVLRNASDTGRIRHLLEEFPEAKFIHVIRNPFTTIQATIERWSGMCGNWALQTYDLDVLRRQTFEMYELAMRRFYEDEPRIPPGNLVTVRYEQILSEPLDVLRRVYEQFGIPGFEEMRPRFEQHLAAEQGELAGHAGFDLTADEQNWIRERLGFVFDKMGYSPDMDDARNDTLRSHAE
jgi:hypothetical protein